MCPSMTEAGRHLAFYVGAAVLFGLFVWFEWGGQYAGEFYAGWLTEYSLSVDNLFVFLLIMASFGVPQKLQQSALMVGIVIAIVLRGIFIALGAVVINAFSWVFYIFGAFLVYTAVKLATRRRERRRRVPGEPLDQFGRARFPATKEWNGTRAAPVIENGKRLITPMLIVIIALGTTDLLFALDSIPAIYGLTKEPFLVLTANIFALMGLRQLYFLIGGLLKQLVYLSIGLAVLLAFIGVKLILHALHENNLPFINGGEPSTASRTSRSRCRWAPSCSSSASRRSPACGSQLATPDSNRRTPPAEGCGPSTGPPSTAATHDAPGGCAAGAEVSGSGPTSRPPATEGWRAVGANWR